MAVRRAYLALFGCSIQEHVAASSAIQEPLKKASQAKMPSDAGEPHELLPLGGRVRRHGRGEAGGVSAGRRHREEAAAPRRRCHNAIRIVTTRSKSQLRATLHQYRQYYGTDMVEDIGSYCSGQFARMMKSTIWCLTSPEKHFAEVIRHSILGLGTYEDALTRVAVSRAEIDMKQIREEYEVRYTSTVARDVVGDTSFG
ncbi:hypothetical protein GUJ93_ZPchr0007g4036 [Zizania palustris]|uniref:Annexin n=1 Tax=Zizania palustris TaxID=103762 RepID=A0A8J5VSL0_ZIZPA|nr:hypothetical protein GUJ93_ZPchr0007g4036 [Zizania palustris]